MRIHLKVCVLLGAVFATFVSGVNEKRLAIEGKDAPRAYFTCDGEALLSFGGLSDFALYVGDTYDYKMWADWASEHGMYHIRAYPQVSWRHADSFVVEQGGSKNFVVYSFVEGPGASPENLIFDLTSKTCEYVLKVCEQFGYAPNPWLASFAFYRS